MLDFSYSFSEENRATLTVSVQGNVRFAGLQMRVQLPRGIAVEGYTVEGTANAINLSDGELLVVFLHVTDLTEPTEILHLTFSLTEEAEELLFETTLDEMYDQDVKNVSYRVIGTHLVLQ